MRILIACEFSGIVRSAFREAGHDAHSCDLIECEDYSAYHHVRDVRTMLDWGWDLMIAHPPCTFLTLAGARWLYDDRYPNRRKDMKKAINFFKLLQNAPIKKIAIENPQPMQIVMDQVGRYTQKIQPWQFGEPETKGICLWLKNLPLLIPTKIVEERRERVWRMPPGPNRQKDRSRFFKGVAKAMVEQWGN